MVQEDVAMAWVMWVVVVHC